MVEQMPCNLCNSPFTPEGKCHRFRWERCEKRLKAQKENEGKDRTNSD